MAARSHIESVRGSFSPRAHHLPAVSTGAPRMNATPEQKAKWALAVGGYIMDLPDFEAFDSKSRGGDSM